METKSFTVSTKVTLNITDTWNFFFNQLNNWWSKDFHTSPRTKKFIIETFIGGRMYEDFGEGEGLIWGHVLGVDFPNFLLINGFLTADFGGPAISYDKFKFSTINQGTLLELHSEFIGEISHKSIQSLKAGWNGILNDSFKDFCER